MEVFIMSRRGEVKKFYFEGWDTPNGTIVPDAFFDEVAPLLPEGELRVLLYIIRRTFGFKKASDDISLKQLVEGIRTQDGRVLDSGAGVAKSSAVRAVKGLIAKGIVRARRNQSKERGYEATTYALRFKSDPLSHHETRGACSTVKQALVSPRNIQETVRQETDVEISNFEKQKQDEKKNGVMSRGAVPKPQRQPTEQGREPNTDRPHPARHAEPEGSNRRIPEDTELAVSDEARPAQQTMTLGAILEQRRELARFRAMAQGEPVASTLPAAMPVGERSDVQTPRRPDATAPRRGRPPGSREEREHLAAYLAPWLSQFNDQAPPSSSITRAYNTFKAANVAPGLWGDFLHQAKAILREHQTNVTKQAAKSTNILQPKNLTPYYFAVLEDLVGLKVEPEGRKAYR